jgi:hypothetical protein
MAGSVTTIELAAIRAFLNASGVETSGTAAPWRTAMPMPPRATPARVSALMAPLLAASSIAGADCTTTSYGSLTSFCATMGGEPTVSFTSLPVSLV